MSEEPNGSGAGRGVQAYRWLVTIGMGATVALAGLILSTVKETATDVTALKIGMSTLTATQGYHTSRLDGIDRRNDSQDGKIDAIQQRVWQLPLGPPSRQLEEQQRQQWQQK